MTEVSRSIRIENSDTLSRVLGRFDENINTLQDQLNVEITCRDNTIKTVGTKDNVEEAIRTLKQLKETAEKGLPINKDTTEYLISVKEKEKEENFASLNEEIVCFTTKGKPIRPKTFGQKKYLDAIDANEIVFGVGPAGTGKTYLAMAKAITAFKNEEVDRLILTRPAVEAGERLGFLPGDLQDKVDPYLRPLYDALYEILGAESFKKNMEKGLIEVAPLAYMRGRTLENAYIILDEAQNTTPEQMKMFLTRFGQGSKIVVTGDATQIDLPAGKKSGLIEAQKILKGIKGISFINFKPEDVVRNRLVQKIIEAYDKFNHERKKESHD